MDTTAKKFQQASFSPSSLGHRRVDDEYGVLYQPRVQATLSQGHAADANAVDEAGKLNSVSSEYFSQIPSKRLDILSFLLALGTVSCCVAFQAAK